MITYIPPRVYLFECSGCGLHIYSDRLGTNEVGCFFCGERLNVLLEVEKIPKEIKEQNKKNISWITKVGLIMKKIF